MKYTTLSCCQAADRLGLLCIYIFEIPQRRFRENGHYRMPTTSPKKTRNGGLVLRGHDIIKGSLTGWISGVRCRPSLRDGSEKTG